MLLSHKERIESLKADILRTRVGCAEMTDKKRIVLSVIAVLVLVLGIIGVSYAAFTYSRTGEKVNTITTGTISMEYQESSNVISITNALPTTDATGKVRLNSGEYFDFTVITDIQGNANINWEIAAEDLEDSTFSGINIKYYLTRLDGENEVEVMAPRTYAEETASNEVTGRPSNMMSLLKGSTSTNGKVNTNYRLRLYVDEKYNPQSDNGNLVYKTRINVYGKVGDVPVAMTNKLISDYTNPSSVTAYADGDKTKMYTFQQPAREQQTGYTAEELTEYRYIGNVPNNYITFNDEVWRIIGVFTVENKDGNKEQRVKIMREESIGEFSWDNTTIENSLGKNRWSDAQLSNLLNGGHESESDGGSLYWNRKSGTCYVGQNNATIPCDFTTTGLTEDAKSKISDAKWYLGGSPTYNQSVEVYHEKERGTSIFSSTTYPRETSWIGTVGLIYPSDYGYTYSLGVNTTCYGNLYSCSSSNGGIPTNGWMFNSATQWTLSPNSSVSYRVFIVNSAGDVNNYNVYNTYGVRPVVYLKSDIKLSSGTGTSSDPFKIS